MRKASSAKTTFNHFANLIILLRRANSWIIHEFGRVNVRQKRRRRYSMLRIERHAAENLHTYFLPQHADGARANSWTIHEFGRVLNAKKRQVQDLSFFGAEDEIRTRATVSHTTPLAGEPLEPLGYFCIAQAVRFIQKAIILYHVFLCLSNLFYIKNKKSS